MSRETVSNNGIQSRHCGIAEELHDYGQRRQTTHIRCRPAEDGDRYGVDDQNANRQGFQTNTSGQQTEDYPTGGAPEIAHRQYTASLRGSKTHVRDELGGPLEKEIESHNMQKVGGRNDDR